MAERTPALRETTVLRTFTELHLLGDYDPATLSSQLGIDPEALPPSVQVFSDPSGSFTMALTGEDGPDWWLSSQGLPPDMGAGEQLLVLLGVLGEAQLARIAELGLELWADCYWAADGMPSGPVFDAPVVAALARAGARLTIDVVAPDA